MKRKIIIGMLATWPLYCVASEDCSKFPNLAPYVSGCNQAERQSADQTLQELGADIRRRQNERNDNPEFAKKKVDAAIRDYLDCVQSAAPLVDDKISDVATIAVGVRSYCSDRLDAISRESMTSSAQQWGEMLQPGVVQLLLMHRVGKRSPATRPSHPPATSRPNT